MNMKIRLVLITISIAVMLFGRWQIKREDGDFMTQTFGVVYLIGGFIMFLICLVAPSC